MLAAFILIRAQTLFNQSGLQKHMDEHATNIYICVHMYMI